MKAKNSSLRFKQTWRRGKENNEGWFTLKNERSALFLNWNSLHDLTLEGDQFIVSYWLWSIQIIIEMQLRKVISNLIWEELACTFFFIGKN